MPMRPQVLSASAMLSSMYSAGCPSDLGLCHNRISHQAWGAGGDLLGFTLAVCVVVCHLQARAPGNHT